MSQSTDLSLSDQARSAFRTELNSIIAALASKNSGATEPSYKAEGVEWLDKSGTPWLHKVYDGSDWIITGSYNATSNIFTPYVAGVAIGAAAQYGLGDGVEASGGNIRVKLDGTTLARSSSGMKVAAGGIGTTQLDTTGVTAGTYTNTDLEVGADGRVIAAADGSGASGSIGQGDLDTSIGTFSGSAATAVAYSLTSTVTLKYGSIVTMPGGQYGFMVQSRINAGSTLGGWWPGNNANSYATCAIPFVLSSANETILGQQRYFNASPPFDHGDGETGGYIYLLVDASGRLVSHYAADVPPWAYNGPTQVWANFICGRTGQKYRRKQAAGPDVKSALSGSGYQRRPKMRPLLREMVAAELERQAKKPTQRALMKKDRGAYVTRKRDEIRARLLDEHFEPITMDMKMRDMALIPHPFGTVEKGQTVVLLDPMCKRVRSVIECQHDGGADEIMERLLSGDIYADNTPLKRAPIPGVMQCALKFK